MGHSVTHTYIVLVFRQTWSEQPNLVKDESSIGAPCLSVGWAGVRSKRLVMFLTKAYLSVIILVVLFFYYYIFIINKSLLLLLSYDHHHHYYIIIIINVVFIFTTRYHQYHNC